MPAGEPISIGHGTQVAKMILSRFGPALRGVLLVLAVAPMATTLSIRQPAWDELFFLHRAACVDREVFTGSAAGVNDCLAQMAKSPPMAFLQLPAGPLQDAIDKLAAAPFVLALVTFALALLLGWMTQRGGMPLLAVAGAALAVRLCGPLATAGAPFLVDAPLTILTALLLLLPWLEHASPATGRWPAVRRGLLWGGIAAGGMLAKLTFAMFGVLIAPLLLLISFQASGLRNTMLKIAGASAGCLLAVLMFALYGAGYLAHARGAAFGELASFYDDHLTRWVFLGEAVRGLGVVYWLILAGLQGVALWQWRRDRLRLALALAAGAVAIAYLLLASGSPNKDPRFFWPVWITLPFAAAAALPERLQAPAAIRSFAAAPGLALMILLSLPMVSRFDLQAVRDADALMRTLPRDRTIRLIIASDEGAFNIETLSLAREVDNTALHNIRPETVIYDIVHGLTPEQSEQKLLSADYVLIRSPISADEPEWTNRFLPRFLATAQRCGRLVMSRPGTPETLLFAMSGSECALDSASPKQ